MTPQGNAAGKKSTRETPFSVSVEEREQAVVVRLAGSCTMDVSGQLARCLRSVAAQGVRLLILELSGLDFIESAGLGGIIAGHLRVRRSNGEVRLVAPQPPIRELLELTRLTQLFQIFESVEDAIRSSVA
jgi:anti-sigma B factor antagonist